jgi:hypothetical protein
VQGCFSREKKIKDLVLQDISKKYIKIKIKMQGLPSLPSPSHKGREGRDGREPAEKVRL